MAGLHAQRHGLPLLGLQEAPRDRRRLHAARGELRSGLGVRDAGRALDARRRGRLRLLQPEALHHVVARAAVHAHVEHVRARALRADLHDRVAAPRHVGRDERRRLGDREQPQVDVLDVAVADRRERVALVPIERDAPHFAPPLGQPAVEQIALELVAERAQLLGHGRELHVDRRTERLRPHVDEVGPRVAGVHAARHHGLERRERRRRVPQRYEVELTFAVEHPHLDHEVAPALPAEARVGVRVARLVVHEQASARRVDREPEQLHLAMTDREEAEAAVLRQAVRVRSLIAAQQEVDHARSERSRALIACSVRDALGARGQRWLRRGVCGRVRCLGQREQQQKQCSDSWPAAAERVAAEGWVGELEGISLKPKMLA